MFQPSLERNEARPSACPFQKWYGKIKEQFNTALENGKKFSTMT